MSADEKAGVARSLLKAVSTARSVMQQERARSLLHLAQARCYDLPAARFIDNLPGRNTSTRLKRLGLALLPRARRRSLELRDRSQLCALVLRRLRTLALTPNSSRSRLCRGGTTSKFRRLGEGQKTRSRADGFCKFVSTQPASRHCAAFLSWNGESNEGSFNPRSTIHRHRLPARQLLLAAESGKARLISRARQQATPASSRCREEGATGGRRARSATTE